MWSWPYGGRRELLYVGKTTSPELRFAQHLADPTKPWWSHVADPANQVDPAAITVTEYASEELALAAEEAAIKAERPRYNVIHNGGRELEPAAAAGPAFASPTGWEPLDGGRG